MRAPNRYLGLLLLPALCLAAVGCANSSPQRTNSTVSDAPDSQPRAETTANSDPNEQPASITSRGSAIEHDLDAKFSRAEPID